MLVPQERSSAVLVIINSKSVSSATVLMLDELIAVKKNLFLRGYPSLMSSFNGNLLTQRHEMCSQ